MTLAADWHCCSCWPSVAWAACSLFDFISSEAKISLTSTSIWFGFVQSKRSSVQQDARAGHSVLAIPQQWGLLKLERCFLPRSPAAMCWNEAQTGWVARRYSFSEVLIPASGWDFSSVRAVSLLLPSAAALKQLGWARHEGCCLSSPGSGVRGFPCSTGCQFRSNSLSFSHVVVAKE